MATAALDPVRWVALTFSCSGGVPRVPLACVEDRLMRAFPGAASVCARYGSIRGHAFAPRFVIIVQTVGIVTHDIAAWARGSGQAPYTHRHAKRTYQSAPLTVSVRTVPARWRRRQL